MLISSTNASATVEVSFSSSNLRTMKLNRTCVVSSSIGVVVAMLIASTMPAEPHLREAGAVVVHVDAAVGDAARRHVRLLRQHHRARARRCRSSPSRRRRRCRARTGSARGRRRSPTSPAARCGSRTTTVVVAPRGIADLVDLGDLPLRLDPRRGGTTRARSRCARRPGTCAAAPCGSCAGCTGCSCTRRSPSKRPAVERALELVAAAPCRRTPRCAPRCGQYASWRWKSPPSSRQSTSSRLQ